jgi:hypothetical protein
MRDEWLLAQSRLTLPATSPDPLAPGEMRVQVDLDWGNDFGLQGRAKPPQDVRFLVDGEHRTASLDVRRGLGSRFVLGARLPVRWRGPGVLDGLIDAWHRLTGLPDNRRSFFPDGRLRVEGRDALARPVEWSGAEGAGVGDLELSGLWAFRHPPRPGWSAALLGRVALPTGTGAFRSSGVDTGAQLVAAHPLGSRLDLYLGLGGTFFGDRERDGLRYVSARPEGFFAFEWRPAARLSLLGQVNAAGGLLDDVPAYVGRHIHLRAGLKRGIGRGVQLQAGFVEGASSVQSTTDFGVFLGVSRSLGPRGR